MLAAATIAALSIAAATTALFAREAFESDASAQRKAAAIGVRFVHDLFVIAFVMIAAWVLLSKKWEIAALFMLNCMLLAYLMSFLAYRRCALSIFYEKILGLEACHPYVSPIAWLLGRAKKRVSCERVVEAWVWDALPRVALVFALNMSFAWHFFSRQR